MFLFKQLCNEHADAEERMNQRGIGLLVVVNGFTHTPLDSCRYVMSKD